MTSRRRVLVVDDSDLLRQVLQDAFRSEGYDVETAADGSEALRLLSESRPDLIVADILMPVMDGWSLCREIRRNPTTSDIPLVFLTTERDVPKRIKGLAMGADDFVCKPFSKEELIARANSILRRAGAAGAARGPAAAAMRNLPDLLGSTSHIAITDLLQILSQNGESGTLHLWGRSVARIYFRAGQIINAETQGLSGEKALFRIMAWPSARFEFEPGEPARAVEATLRGSTSAVIMEGFAHLDELRDLIASLPASDRRIRAAGAGGDAAAGNADLTTSERLILHTAGSRGATVADIIDTVPERDLEAYQALDRLIRRGLVEAVDADTAPTG